MTNRVASASIVVALSILATSARAEALYNVYQVGPLPGDTWAVATGLNNAGQVVGISNKGSGGDAFLYSGGQLSDLGPAGGTGNPLINQSGQIYDTTQGDPNRFTTAMNDAGQTASYGNSPVDGRPHAYETTNGTTVDLGLIGNGGVRGINDAGTVVGFVRSGPSNASRAFVASNGQMTLLPLPPGSSESFGTGINNAGQVVGGGTHAFLYSAGKMLDLGTLGGTLSQALAINDHGTIVGYSQTKDFDLSAHAFLYTDGKMTDLNSLISPALGITLLNASAINDSGQILAWGTNRDGSSAQFFLSTQPIQPVPEPSPIGLPALLVLAAGVRPLARRCTKFRRV